MNDKQQAAEKSAQISEYSAAEFAANSKSVFGVMPECVTAAFRVANIDRATKAAAEKLIREFMNKEVI